MSTTDPYEFYKNDPVGFARDVLGTNPWGMQFLASQRREPARRWRVHYIASDPTGSCKGTMFVHAATAGVAIRKATKSLQSLPGLLNVWVESRE